MVVIPEGYTYIRCDQYSPDEFLAMYANKGLTDICKEYIKDNPKGYYTTDDEVAIHNIRKGRMINRLPGHTTKRTHYLDRWEER